MAEKIEARFLQALGEIPAPGPGDGCNLRLLGVANHGVFDGLDAQKIFDQIRQHITPGPRRVADAEIWRAVQKALEMEDRYQ